MFDATAWLPALEKARNSEEAKNPVESWLGFVMWRYGYLTEPPRADYSYPGAGSGPDVGADQEFSAAVFKARIANPFIEVVEQDDFRHCRMDGDKVRDGKAMDEYAYRLAVRSLIATKFRQAFACKEDIEINLHEPLLRHACWLEELSMLTKPIGSSTEHLDDALQDIEVTSKTMQLSPDRSILPDFRVQAYDPKVQKMVTVLSVVCKSVDMAQSCGPCLYEAADGISRSGALSNLRAGRTAPIFVEWWGCRYWAYGMLFPEGIVLVKAGRVVRDASLQEMLEERSQLAESVFGKTFVYDGFYVAGTLMINPVRRRMPVVPLTGAGRIRDLFLHTLMRIVIGDQVLHWDEDDMRRTLKQRRDLLAKLEETYFGDFSGPSAPLDKNVEEPGEIAEADEHQAKRTKAAKTSERSWYNYGHEETWNSKSWTVK